MVTFVLFFLCALAWGSVSELRGARICGAVLMFGFAVFVAVWQAKHGWPGLLNSAFMAGFGGWVTAILLGVLLGGAFISPWMNARMR